MPVLLVEVGQVILMRRLSIFLLFNCGIYRMRRISVEFGAVLARLLAALPGLGIAIAWMFVVGCGLVSAAGPEKNWTADTPAPPDTPKLSSFAPAMDLANQVRDYIKEIEKTLASEQEYKDSEEKIGRCTATLGVIALCLGLHDEPSEYKARAAALIKATQELAATTDYQSAKKACDGLKAAAEGKIRLQGELNWEKVASLPDLMKQVPNINTKLKRNIKGAKFKTKAKETAGYAATIAAIAQGAMFDTGAAKNPQEINEWYGFSTEMRDSAGAANSAIHAGNEPAAAEAMQKLAKSCTDCHTVFHPEAILTEESNNEK
jgi:hypothetical protein